MKPKITARSFQLLVLALLGLALAACTGVRPTAATPTVQVALTQAATRVPTQYVTATPTPRPPTATPSPRPTSQATRANPSVLKTPTEWAVPARQVYITNIEGASWQTANTVEFHTADNVYLIDLASQQTTVEPRFAPTTTPPDHIPSADGRYFAQCVDKSSIGLHQVVDGQTLWEFKSPNIDCYSVAWAGSLPVLSFVLWQEPEFTAAIYLWQEGAREPRLAYQSQGDVYPSPKWSPDGSRLVLLEDFTKIVVIRKDGQNVVWDDVPVWVDAFSMDWVSDEVISIWGANGACCAASQYFQVTTGKEFPAWYNDFDLSQPPAYSPDLRWRITDNSHRAWRGDPYASVDYYPHDYGLLNFESTRYDELFNGENQYLQFVGWTEDNAKFYLVSRPATADALSVPNIPFGLLALNPETRQFNMLFEQAALAKLSPDKHLAWVVFPAKHADGTLGLDGGIFNLADGTLVGRQFVSDRVLYANPAEGDLVPAAWSNDGTRVVFGDSQGNLTLVKTDGTTQSLAANLPHDGWPSNAHCAWSPDDKHLLVQSGNRAWIVSVP